MSIIYVVRVILCICLFSFFTYPFYSPLSLYLPLSIFVCTYISSPCPPTVPRAAPLQLISKPTSSQPPVTTSTKPTLSVLTPTITSTPSSSSSSAGVQLDSSPAQGAVAGATTAAMPTTHFSNKPILINRPAGTNPSAKYVSYSSSQTCERALSLSPYRNVLNTCRLRVCNFAMLETLLRMRKSTPLCSLVIMQCILFLPKP